MTAIFPGGRATELKCAQCQAIGLASTVYNTSMITDRVQYLQGADETDPDQDRSVVRTWQLFYDEQGSYHIHDPNPHIFTYECTNEHHFTAEHLDPCPNPKCDWVPPPR